MKDTETQNIIIIYPIVLIAITFIAHYLSFESVCFSPDTYCNYVSYDGLNVSQLLELVKQHSDRPLGCLVYYPYAKIVGIQPKIGMIVTICLNLIMILSAFYLLYLLMKDIHVAFVCCVIYILLPNKFSMFNNTICAFTNIYYILIAACIIMYLAYVKSGNKTWLYSSLCTYAILAFSYEATYMIPFVILALAIINGYSKKPIMLFLIPAILYPIYRLTYGFGISEGIGVTQRPIVLSSCFDNFISIFQFYLGKGMAKPILYGIRGFFHMPGYLIVICLIGTIISLFLLLRVLPDKIYDHYVDRKTALLTGSAFFLFFAPNLLGTVSGRHTTAASIGLSIIIYYAVLRRLGKAYKPILVIACVGCIIVAQGMAWNHVVASRINGSVFEYMKENRLNLEKAKLVVFDSRSFANNIDYTWINRERNVLNTYFGAQAFAPWGIRSMVRIVTEDKGKIVDVLSKVPEEYGKDSLRYLYVHGEKDEDGVWGTVSSWKTVPRDGAFLINYDTVYANGYKNGKRLSFAVSK